MTQRDPHLSRQEHAPSKGQWTQGAKCVWTKAALVAIGGACGLASDKANAEEAIQWGASYQGDLVSSWGNGVNGRGRALDSLHVTMDADLAEALPFQGPIIHADINMTSGAAPNDDAGTLQGVDNIEVGRARTRLYEIWAEQRLLSERASLRAGFQELNSEFYATDSSGLLMNPSFGLSPELSATGSNGPSTYPSTAIAARGFLAVTDDVDMNIGVFNADALNIGDAAGPDLAFDHGALVIGQVTWRGPANISAGVWTYSDKQDDLRDTDAAGDPIRREGRGVYFMAEKKFWGRDGGAEASGFLRAGASDGDTTDFGAAWQAGILLNWPWASRPDSAASIGVAQARITGKSRANALDAGIDAASSETILETAYSDKLAPWLTIQPDIQIAFNPGGDRSRDETITLGLRISITPADGE